MKVRKLNLMCFQNKLWSQFENSKNQQLYLHMQKQSLKDGFLTTNFEWGTSKIKKTKIFLQTKFKALSTITFLQSSSIQENNLQFEKTSRKRSNQFQVQHFSSIILFIQGPNPLFVNSEGELTLSFRIIISTLLIKKKET